LNVAQVSNLLYRRFPIGRAVASAVALETAKRLRVGNPRYSRFGNLRYGAVATLNKYPGTLCQFTEVWWAQLDLNQRPSDYELCSVGLFRVASGRHRLRYPCFYWVSRWRPATPHNSTQPLRTEELAKNWPSTERRQAPLRFFTRSLAG